MSGLYLSGMEMPTSCGKCLDVGWHYVFECVLDDVECGERRTDCPLVPVPPHGKLVEEGEVKNKIANFISDDDFGRGWNAALKRILEALEEAPTIIPAEEVDNG